MTDRFGLSEQDIAAYQSTFSAFPSVKRVMIYGSRAKGNYRRASDIDLTVMDKIDWATFIALEAQIDDLMLPYQVDLSIYTQIDNPDLVDHIQRVGQVFYEKTP
ncbi:Predicted nucleotidyltransferase [Oceanospirillum multiglobuliferum]|uniref:Polymerase beta nucleotidyltransferase domain-containing protein n=1 Tax=Oceanospirillum multiglobuliferum TaxID=64969 RepID=A0A1T4RA40_9GAMM|nr:nucleotidyltransferase domain-containing protein [Oceanospirillum multiglobuliferum]OPX55146.1 hypothetical protein BTE48_10295 [Oceanospirillum multiglobuliferum]SKA12843.1 Predicted nucleotidyltransferase [Oceanospirillum multiglobuliferum]